MSSNGTKKVVIGVKDGTNLSPVANLAINFSDASLSAPSSLRIRARHLSMSSLTPDTPVSTISLEINDGRLGGTPRFSRNGQRLSSGKGTLMRRLNSAPVTSFSCEGKSSGQDGNKENSRLLMLSPLKRDATASSLGGSPLRPKTPLETHDGNSQDSGFAQDDSQTGFRFAEPNGFAPKKLGPSPKKIFELSSPKALSSSNLKSASEAKVSSISFSSTESSDDGFLELGDLDKSFSDENTTELPVGMDNLLNGPLFNLNETIGVDDDNDGEAEEDIIDVSSRRPLRRVQSLLENFNSPASSKVRVGLFRDDVLSPSESSPFEKLSFKRPREVENNAVKRRKYASGGVPQKQSCESRNPRYKLQRSISDTAAFSLVTEMHKSDLIADFSRPYALPVVSGRHEDLKSISSETLADLINGNYSNTINSFRIIDCRYPYEYEGGHIKGSINLYTKEQVQQELFGCASNQNTVKDGHSDRRNILIFHCEFSLERGPTLYRFLRRCDRNVSSYPCLFYPEVYLLHGGYESFFANYKSLCEPCSYQPMVDPKHENDLKKFRIKSSSWSGEGKRSIDRTGLKRLGLF